MREHSTPAGFVIHPGIAAGMAAVLLGTVLCASFCQCDYRATGDGATYIGQMLKIRDGYIRRNLDARQAAAAGRQEPRPVEMSTEAGYAFLLSAARRLFGERAPFHVNSVLMPLALTALAAVVWIAAGGGVRGWLSGLFLFSFLLAPHITRRELMSLSGLMRDAPAHLLGFAALGGVLLAGRAGRRGARAAAAAAGLAIGLSCWFRLTGILVALPAGLFLVTGRGRRAVAEGLLCGALMASGIVAGLLPLAAQNWLEGKSLLRSGQVEALLAAGGEERRAAEPRAAEEEQRQDAERGGTAPAPDEVRRPARRPAGFHLAYFSAWFPRVLRGSVSAFGPWYRFAVLAAAGLSLIAAARCGSMLLLSALMPLLLYSCYDKILWRYTFQGSMPAAAAAAVGAAWATDRVLARLSTPRRRSLASGLLAASLAIPVLAGLHDEGLNALELGARWRKTDMVRAEMEGSFLPSDVLFSYDQGFRRTVEMISGDAAVVRKWGDKETRESRIAMLDALFAEGKRRVFFLGRIADDGREQVSWWKDDMLNEYDMTPAGPRFNGKFMCHRVLPRRLLRREVALDSVEPGGSNLYLFARKLSVPGRWQDVRLLGPGGAETAARIQTGPNILPLPPGFEADPAAPAVTLCSSNPLPSVVSAAVIGRKPALMKWCSYENVFTLARAASRGVEVRWFGFPMWKRDHGGYDAKRMSRPLWRMPPGSSIRIPAFAGDMRVRLYFSAYGFDERAAELAAALPSSLAGIRFRVGSAVLAPRLILMRPVERRKAARAVDFALDLPVPAAAAAGADPDLAIDFRPLQEWDMLLYQVEFIAGSAQDGLPPPDGPPSVAWRAGDSRDTWGPGGRLDGEFRALAGPATVRVDAAEGALLFFYWPSRSASGQCSLSLTAGTNTTELALKPSDRPVEHLVRFSGGAGGVVQISPAFDTQPDVWPVLNFVAPVPSPSAGAPARLTMESGRVSSLLLDGFWGPEPQPDGSVIRWTKERATVRLPVLDPSRGLRIELAAQGGPPKLGDIPVRALVNDREIGTATAVPGVAQTLVFRVPAERLVAGMNRLAIEARTWKPSERLRSDDTRSLGVALRSVQWRPDSE